MQFLVISTRHVRRDVIRGNPNCRIAYHVLARGTPTQTPSCPPRYGVCMNNPQQLGRAPPCSALFVGVGLLLNTTPSEEISRTRNSSCVSHTPVCLAEIAGTPTCNNASADFLRFALPIAPATSRPAMYVCLPAFLRRFASALLAD